MEIEQFLEDSTLQNRSFLENTPDFKTCNYVSESMSESNNGQSSCFDCNICLDSVHDPVVTLCGHLFCWPCIYKWLSVETNSLERQDRQRCPVCKAQVSHSTLVPLYGKGSTEKPSKSKSLHLGIVIPRRPLAPTSCGNESPRSYTHTTTSQHNGYSVRAGNYNSHSSSSEGLGPGQTMTSLLSPMNGGFGQMVYARAFGNDITNLYAYPNSHDLYRSVNSPRVRRLIMETDKSLNRICLFLFCCLILCLLTF